MLRCTQTISRLPSLEMVLRENESSKNADNHSGSNSNRGKRKHLWFDWSRQQSKLVEPNETRVATSLRHGSSQGCTCELALKMTGTQLPGAFNIHSQHSTMKSNSWSPKQSKNRVKCPKKAILAAPMRRRTPIVFSNHRAQRIYQIHGQTWQQLKEVQRSTQFDNQQAYGGTPAERLQGSVIQRTVAKQ